MKKHLSLVLTVIYVCTAIGLSLYIRHQPTPTPNSTQIIEKFIEA